MQLLYYSLAIYLSLTSPAEAASGKKESKEIEHKPCTITSPSSGAFFDLTSLQLPDPKQSKAKHPREHSWNATGYDLGYNFTVNICGPVLEPVEDVVGVDKALWRNISAYYKQDGKIYSLGWVQVWAKIVKEANILSQATELEPYDAWTETGPKLYRWLPMRFSRQQECALGSGPHGPRNRGRRQEERQG